MGISEEKEVWTPCLAASLLQRSWKFVFLLPSPIITQSFLCWTHCSKNNNAKGQNSLEKGCKWAESCFWCRVGNIRIKRKQRTKRSSLLYRKGTKGRTFGENKAKRTRTVTSNVPVLKAANPSGRGNFSWSQSLEFAERKCLFCIFSSKGFWTLLLRSEPKYSLFSLLTLSLWGKGWSAAASPPSQQSLNAQTPHHTLNYALVVSLSSEQMKEAHATPSF